MKQSSITFKTTPEVKKFLETLAKQGFRSLSSQVEMIVIKYLEEQSIDPKEEGEKEAAKR
jgi:transcriptional regulator of NAD metabolism